MSKLNKFPKTEIFKIVNTLGMPHPFMIGSKHVKYASNNHNGILGSKAIRAYEKKKGPSCCMKGCNLSYDEHKQVLLVEVDSQEKLNDVPGLQEYLQECVTLFDKPDEYEGFSFIKKEENEIPK